MMNRILFEHAHLVIDGNREYEDGAILVNGETIEDVFLNSTHIKKDLPEHETIDLKGKIVMPGFFDTHCHGSFGIDYNKATAEEMDEVSQKLLRKGTTSFLATFLNYEGLIAELKTYEGLRTKGSRLLGIHLEGPFINRKYKGAINEKFILDPDIDKLREYLDASSSIRQMTLSPELKGAKDLIRILKEKGIRVMLGHSDALSEDLKDIDYDGFTHLFNATRPLGHRELSLVNVALSDSDKYVELIADGVHVDKSVLKLAYKNIRRDRLMLISDSTLVAGMDDGECVFEGEKCLKKGLLCQRVVDGRLAGSAAFMADCVKTMREVGASLTDILLMSGLNAYRLYGLDKRFGSLEKGKYADLVILDEDLDLICTYARGMMINA